MHLIETDASTNSLQWFMDSPTTRKSELANLDMIQTSSRIESSLPSRISAGNCRSTQASQMLSAAFKTNHAIHQYKRYHRPIDNVPPNNFVVNSEDPCFNSQGESNSKKCETKHHKKGIPKTSRPSQGQETYSADDKLQTDNNRSSDEQDYDVNQKVVKFQGRSNLTGFINGFIVDAKSQNIVNNGDLNSRCSNGVMKNEDKNRKKDSRGIIEHNGINSNTLHLTNRNNNNHRCVDLPARCRGDDDGITASTDHTNARRTSQGEISSTSNILKKMYASFGANDQHKYQLHTGSQRFDFERNHLKNTTKNGETSSNVKSLPTSSPKRKRKQDLPTEYRNARIAETGQRYDSLKSHPIHPTPIRLTVDADECPEKRRKLNVSPYKHFPNVKSSQVKHSHRDNETVSHRESSTYRGNRTKPSSDRQAQCHNYMEGHGNQLSSETAQYHNNESHSSKIAEVSGVNISANSEIETDRGNLIAPKTQMHYSPETPRKSNTSQSAGFKIYSPGHSIESLISKDRGDERRGSLENNSAGENSPFLDRKRQFRTLDSHQSDSDNAITGPKQTLSRGEMPVHRVRLSPASKPRIGEHDDYENKISGEDKYNDKSREIFMREKEIIENSLRQNGHFPLDISAQAAYFQNPYMINPSALAAFQTNLLSSMHPNAANMLSDPASLAAAAAASANPFLMGLNQYFGNPYLLRGLVGNGLPGPAYNVPGLLPSHQSIMPFINPLSGNSAMYPAANPLLCGGLTLPEPSSMNAAISASIRQGSTPSYPSSSFPYPFITPPTQPNTAPMNSQNNSARSSPSEELDESKLSSREETSDFNQLSRREKVRYVQRHSNDVGRNYTTSTSTRKEVESPNKEDIPAPSTHPGIHRRLSMESKRGSGEFVAKNTKIPPSTERSSNLKLKRKPLQSIFSERPAIPKKTMRLQEKQESEFSKASSSVPTSTLLLESLHERKNPDVTINASNNQDDFEKNSARPSSYKNLTRERRLVANARERTRVHTISSAFEELRTQIPSYSCNQKLSKLAILRIACSYIQSLSVLSGRTTEDTFTESVDQCTRVLQAESRARSRRKSNKAQIEWEVANYEKEPEYSSEVHESGDVVRRSLGMKMTKQMNATTKSSPRKNYSQVRDEIPRHKFEDSSRIESEIPRESYNAPTTRLEDSKRFTDQSLKMSSANNETTKDDSLKSRLEYVEHLERADNENDNVNMNHSADSTRNTIATDDTWHEARNSHMPRNGDKSFRNQFMPSAACITDTGKPVCGDDHLDMDDPQNDLINVED